MTTSLNALFLIGCMAQVEKENLGTISLIDLQKEVKDTEGGCVIGLEELKGLVDLLVYLGWMEVVRETEVDTKYRRIAYRKDA